MIYRSFWKCRQKFISNRLDWAGCGSRADSSRHLIQYFVLFKFHIHITLGKTDLPIDRAGLLATWHWTWRSPSYLSLWNMKESNHVIAPSRRRARNARAKGDAHVIHVQRMTCTQCTREVWLLPGGPVWKRLPLSISSVLLWFYV